jgi:hypothetical protein
VITSVTYARLYNLGNYENEKLEVTVSVEDNDATAAFLTARGVVEDEYQRILTARRAPAAPTSAGPMPASDKQRSYLARLCDDLGWSSEQIAVYANEQGIDLVTLTSPQASKLIGDLKRLLDVRSGELPF